MDIELILQQAQQASGTSSTLLDEHTLEGLEMFVSSANREADLSPDGDKRLAGLIIAALTNRLRVEEYLLQHPDILEQPIEKPMFVFGFPRTGTTLTINLLNEDPARRCFLRWEAFQSVPPPKRGEFRNDPRYIAEQAKIDAALQQSTESAAVHHEDADSPTECQLSMAQTMCSQVYEALVHVPRYRQWFLNTSYLPSFRYHKKLLQLLQSEAPGRWTLKNPWHPLFLNDLHTVYPDAQLVMNHRDPVAMVGSACSMINRVRTPFTKHVNKKVIAETLLDTFDVMLKRTLDYKAQHGDESIYDIHYDKLMENPIGEIKKLYERFEEPFSAQAEQAMAAFLARNPQGRFGNHRYQLEDYGLSEAQIRERFSDYCRQFNFPDVK